MWILTLGTFIALIVSAVVKMMGMLALAVIALIVLWPLFSMLGKKDGSKLRMANWIYGNVKF